LKRPTLVSLLVLLCLPAAAPAAPPVDLAARFVLYGDNTEFFNGYRASETIPGAFASVVFRVRLGANVELSAGAFANQRFGGDDAFEQARPVLTLSVGNARSRFLFGTLETVRDEGIGPDRTSLHGLLPPLQVETLAFRRPYEAGIQWLVATERVKNDTWLNWQKLGTSEHREILDFGVNARVRVWSILSAGLQGHYLHQGGQTTHAGAVYDSFGVGPGVVAEPRVGFLDALTFEVWGLVSRDEPDRERPELVTRGHGVLLRAAAEARGFRAHLLGWTGHDFVKVEGDANYQSRSEDGSRFKASRRYGEVGLAKLFRPASGVSLEASFRLHLIDSAVEYSYRLLGRVSFELPVLR